MTVVGLPGVIGQAVPIRVATVMLQVSLVLTTKPERGR